MDTKEIAIAWKNLTYKSKRYVWLPEIIILNHLFGYIEFGSVSALMGPSGSGKTTFLNCIFGKISKGLDKNSKIYLNQNQKIRSCFVGQHEKEHLIMCLTVKENMMFASKLKNSDHNSNDGPIDHKMNVQNIMKELLIDDISDTRVDCCSGGQQKRLTIALEMTTIIKPNLLCLDEPTTGLDSNIAEIVMQCLKNLANNHMMAIITSIHSPNNEIVLSFDKIYVLSKGGNCLFSGHPNQIHSYLKENQIQFNENDVPIEQLLKLASIETKEDYIEDMILKTRESLKVSVVNECHEKTKHSINGLKIHSKAFKLIDLWYVISRMMTVQYIRQWRVLLFQYFIYIFFAIISNLMYDQRGGYVSGCLTTNKTLGNIKCLDQIEEDKNLLFNYVFITFFSIMALMIHFLTSALAYSNDVKIYFHEHQNAWYSTFCYFLAKGIVEVLPTILFSSTYAYLAYYGSGQLLETQRITLYVSLIAVGFVVFESLGHFLGILFRDNQNLLVLVSVSLFSVMNIYNNYFFTTIDLPIVFQYISYTSFIRLISNSALLIVYGMNRCTPEEKSEVLINFHIKDEELIYNFVVLIFLTIILRIMSYFVLYFSANTFKSLNILKVCSKKTTNSISDEIYKTSSDNDYGEEQKIQETKFININLDSDKNEFGLELENICENHICIVWKDLSLNVSKGLFSDKKVILNNINGFLEFGTLNALMGCSGAGKTSLLKCINGFYNNYLSDETTILLSKFYKIRTCFITQNQKDHILIGLTAGQSITYASKLKNADKNFDHKKNVKNIMNELLISNTFDTNGENCSGGEQKRIVIAMELTSALKPNLLCIDEPTSGLDSYAAEVVIKCLQRLSKSHNICVITSIHQPNNDILMMFDKLYVLSKGGNCVYSGTPNHISQYLAECDIQYSKIQIPIEVLLKYSCNDIIDTNVSKMVNMTSNLEKELIEKRAHSEAIISLDGIRNIPKRFYLRDLWILINRGLTYILRFYWKICLLQFIVYISIGLFFQIALNPEIGRPSGCISYDDDINNCDKSEARVKDNNLITKNIKYIFMLSLFVTFFSMTATVMSFAMDIKMFCNEHRNSWYSTGVYYWSKSFIELIPISITTVCFSYIIDIYEPENSMLWPFIIYLTLCSISVQSVAQVLGILASDKPRLAMLAIASTTVFLYLFSNAVILLKPLHYSLQLISNLSHLKLLYESLLITFYGLNRCADSEFSLTLHMLYINDRDLTINLQLIVLHFFLFRAIALLILLLKVNPLINTKKERIKRKDITQQLRQYINSIIRKQIF